MKPSDLVNLEGVELIMWRTFEQHQALLDSFEKRDKEKTEKDH